MIPYHSPANERGLLRFGVKRGRARHALNELLDTVIAINLTSPHPLGPRGPVGIARVSERFALPASSSGNTKRRQFLVDVHFAGLRRPSFCFEIVGLNPPAAFFSSSLVPWRWRPRTVRADIDRFPAVHTHVEVVVFGAVHANN